jgi:hypothetical protein
VYSICGRHCVVGVLDMIEGGCHHGGRMRKGNVGGESACHGERLRIFVRIPGGDRSGGESDMATFTRWEEVMSMRESYRAFRRKEDATMHDKTSEEEAYTAPMCQGTCNGSSYHCSWTVEDRFDE